MSKAIRVKARAVPNTEAFGFANSGTEQVGVRIEVIEGEHAGFYSWYGYFTDKAGERTIEALKTMGWNEDWAAFSRKQLPGLGETEYEQTLEWDTPKDGGEGYWRPTFVNRIGVAMKKQMDDAEAMDFAKRMRALYGGAAAKPAQQRPQQRQPAAGPAQQRTNTRPAQAEPPVDDAPLSNDEDQMNW